MFLSKDALTRYARHLVLKEVGGPGQRRLHDAAVAIVGVGGLGGPAALYLAAAGAGRLTLIDDDAVDLSNLQRQILFRTEDVGRGKTAAGAGALRALNPDLVIAERAERLTASNAESLLEGHDVILDGTDDFAARFAVNAAALALKTPLVSGAVGRWDGQVGVFCADEAAPCYRCFVADIPPEAEACETAGVIGALTGVVGAMMALEAIKLIVKAGAPLAGRILFYDGLHGETRVTRLPKDPACPACCARWGRAPHSAR